MENEIKEIIKKNLPAHVGDILKTRLEQADKDAELCKTLQESLKNKLEIIANNEKQLTEYLKFDNRNSSLEGREKAVAESERNLEIEKLKFQLASEKEKTDFTKQVAIGLVRNTEYRRVAFNNESNSGGRDQFGNQLFETKNISQTETKHTD